MVGCLIFIMGINILSRRFYSESAPLYIWTYEYCHLHWGWHHQWYLFNFLFLTFRQRSDMTVQYKGDTLLLWPQATREENMNDIYKMNNNAFICIWIYTLQFHILHFMWDHNRGNDRNIIIYTHGIPIIMITRSRDCLFFTMGSPILIRWKLNTSPPSTTYVIYVSANLVNIGSDYGLLPIRHQAII